MNGDTANHSVDTVLAGGGELGALMRAFDWSRTPLGPVETWPQSLRSLLSMLLPSKAQIILFWGPEFIVFYNDAYRPVFGAKHPHALGRPGREAWSEIWDTVLHDLLAGVVRTGEAFWGKDLPVHDRTSWVSRRNLLRRVLRPCTRGVGRRRRRVLHRRRNDRPRDRRASDGAAEGSGGAADDRADDSRRLRARHGDLRGKPQDVVFALAYVDDELQSCTPGRRGQPRARQSRSRARSCRCIRPASRAGRAGSWSA